MAIAPSSTTCGCEITAPAPNVRAHPYASQDAVTPSLTRSACTHSGGDHSGGARFAELSDLPDDLTNTATHARGRVSLTWHADSHVSSFTTGWLRAHCNSKSERHKRRRQLTLWDASSACVPRIDYLRLLDDDRERLRLFDGVRTHGIVCVAGVPAGATELLGAEISICRETHYGRTFEIHSAPNKAGTVIANSGHPLRNHNDELFRDTPSGILIFHCQMPSHDGLGASIMADGFAIAEDLRRDHPQAFHLLTTTPIAHRRFIDAVRLRSEGPPP